MKRPEIEMEETYSKLMNEVKALQKKRQELQSKIK